jgi:hypothetical protein
MSLQRVVVMAETSELIESGDSCGRPPLDVVDLEARADMASGDDAFGIPGEQGRPLSGGDRAPQVGNAANVDAIGDHGGEEGVGHHGPHHLDGDGTDAVDLAALAGPGRAAEQGGMVDPDDDRRRWPQQARRRSLRRFGVASSGLAGGSIVARWTVAGRVIARRPTVACGVGVGPSRLACRAFVAPSRTWRAVVVRRPLARYAGVASREAVVL